MIEIIKTYLVVAVIILSALPTSAQKATDTVRQSDRQIPIISSVDVVVVGGSSAGVAAAEAAAQNDAQVFLVAPRPYLGEDLCAALRLDIKEDRILSSPLEKKLFGDQKTVTPGRVKATLAKTLLDAGVEFRYSSFVTDILRDDQGKACGVIIVNRAGRQAIVAKTIIDATDHAWTCRLAGCPPAPWSGGPLHFERTLLLPVYKANAKGKKGKKSKTKEVLKKVVGFDIDMPDLSFFSLANAEQMARDQTPEGKKLRAAESLFLIPPTSVPCGKSESVELKNFQPQGQERLYVLSGYADVSRDQAKKLLRPAALTSMAVEVGQAAAAQAKALPSPKGAHRPPNKTTPPTTGDIHENLSGGRAIKLELPTLPSQAGSLPILGKMDVIVIGGGTSGAPAAIASSRQGARTLVVEYQEGLGGVGTLGLIAKAYHGQKGGFNREVPFPQNAETKMEWYRKELRKAGGHIWFGSIGCGSYLEDGKVKGAVVCTPEGRGVVLAGVVIDGTGSADIAISAGAKYMYGTVEKGDIALQGTGLSTRVLGKDHNNSDYLLVDDSDSLDVWRALTSVQITQGNYYDTVTLIQSRERRRVVGEHILRYEDQIAERRYPDSIVFSASDYDSHGYPSSPYFGLLPHDKKSSKASHPAPGGKCYTPYRCLLPKGLEGILVIGLGTSMDRDASAMVRMQLDMANQGYAAGVAASMAVLQNKTLRQIDMKELQKHLIKIGNLPAEVLQQKNNFPLPVDVIQQAVRDYGSSTNPSAAGKPLAIIMTHKNEALPFLKIAYRQAEGSSKILYAQVLAALGDNSGFETLLSALEKVTAWDDKIFQGSMAEYAYLPTAVDSLIIALGNIGDPAALDSILKKAKMLDAKTTLSHHRCVAISLEQIADSKAAESLATLLNKEGMQGHAMTSLYMKKKDVENRTDSLREITLARALYHCGDHQGLGEKILKQYKQDFRGLFSRHADEVLSNKGK